LVALVSDTARCRATFWREVAARFGGRREELVVVGGGEISRSLAM